MRILVVHTKYLQKGGEDVVFENESELLAEAIVVEKILFHNRKGILGLIQFFFSILNITSAIRILRRARKIKADIVHFHNWHFAIGPFAIYLLKWFRIPTVLTIHNYRLLCPSSTLFYGNALHPENAKKSFAWSAVFQRAYKGSFFLSFWIAFIVWVHHRLGTWRGVSKYVFLSKFMRDLFADSYLQLNDKQLFVKPNSISDPGLIDSARSDDFIFVGRLTHEKGIIPLLESWKDLPYKLRIFGSGPFQDMAKNYSVRYPNISFHGQTDKNGIVAEMRKCSILLFPSVWYEPFGMTIIEAFACGMPVMAFEIGGISSLIEDGANGILIKDRSVDGFRNAIDRWANLDPTLKKNYQQNARQTFLRFYTNQENLQSLLHIYRSVNDI
jgi:glycosyltransferase involved in cell wall biosynthesis